MTDETLAALAAKIRAREISPVEATEACLARIETLGPRLRAFLHVDAETALRTARIREAEAKAGRSRGPLHGVPLAHKDLFASGGRRGVLRHGRPRVLPRRPGRDGRRAPGGRRRHHARPAEPLGAGARAVRRQRPPRRRRDALARRPLRRRVVERVRGGRGRRPRVRRPRHRHRRLDPAARRVLRRRGAQAHLRAREPGGRDAALVVARPCRPARPDRAGRGGPPRRDRGRRRRATRPRVPARSRTTSRASTGRSPGSGSACPTATTGTGSTTRCGPRSRRRSTALRGLGAQVVECPLPDPALLNDLANVIARCESAAVHARIVRESPHALQPAVRARLEVGFHVSAHDYLQATRLRARATRTFVDDVFARVDVLVAPTIPEPAPALAAVKAGSPDDDRPSHGALLAPDPALERARAAGAQPAVRLRGRWPARGPPAGRPPLRRGDAAPRRPRVRAGGGLVAAAPAARVAASA